MEHIVYWVIGLILVFLSGVISSIWYDSKSQIPLFAVILMGTMGTTLIVRDPLTIVSVVISVVGIVVAYLSGLSLIWIFAEKKLIIVMLILLAIAVVLTAPPGIIPIRI